MTLTPRATDALTRVNGTNLLNLARLHGYNVIWQKNPQLSNLFRVKLSGHLVGTFVCVCAAGFKREEGFPVPHRGQVAHGHVQGLNRVEGDLQPAADQSLLQQAP